ncbi:MAG: T9SS type A sorting domain-containing protein [Ignavibacteriae bacterium]|nr:T9SS type A sorting domain-containing protein [Ignavibacteriota bacterium]
MKKVLIVVFIVLSSVSVNAQWVRLVGLSPVKVNKVVNYYENYLLAGADDVYKSTDSGQTWTVYYNAGIKGINALSVSNGRVFVGNNYNNVYSYDNGSTWRNTNLRQYVYSFYDYYSRILAGTESHRCYYLNYNDSVWVQSTDIWEDVLCFRSSGGTILAGTSQGIYFSFNGGVNWIQAEADGIPFNDIVNSSTALFAGSDFMGVWKSTDYGFIWNKTSLCNVSVKALSSYNLNVFAGTYQNGFYLSTNNGLNWVQHNEGMGNVTINSLELSGSYIYAATENAGLWRRPLTELIGTSSPVHNGYALFELYQNYPNPFNPGTNIYFAVTAGARIKLTVYDASGKEIEQIFDKVFQPGQYSIPWTASKYPSGVYFYKLSSGSASVTKRMVYVR